MKNIDLFQKLLVKFQKTNYRRYFNGKKNIWVDETPKQDVIRNISCKVLFKIISYQKKFNFEIKNIKIFQKLKK